MALAHLETLDASAAPVIGVVLASACLAQRLATTTPAAMKVVARDSAIASPAHSDCVAIIDIRSDDIDP
jgi:hypothetical protein